MASQVQGVIGKLNPGDNKNHAIANTAYGYCETAAATAAKVVDMTGFKLETGITIFVKFLYANTAANPTMNVNGTGAKPIYRYGTTFVSNSAGSNTWHNNAICAFTYDGAGWMMHYWYNTTYNIAQNALGGGNFVANSALYRYQLLFHIDRDRLTPLNNVNNDTGTSKTMLTTVDFDPFEKFYYYNSSDNVAAGGNIGAGSLLYSVNNIDLRYTFNSGTTLTNQKDVYLKLKKQASGLVRIASSNPLTQILPTTNDGFLYMLLGRATSSSNASIYPWHPIFYHNGTEVVQYVNPKIVNGILPNIQFNIDVETGMLYYTY